MHRNGYNRVCNRACNRVCKKASNAANSADCGRGLLSGIRLALKLKFGMAGVALMSEIAQIEDVDALQTILDGIGLAATSDELR